MGHRVTPHCSVLSKVVVVSCDTGAAGTDIQSVLPVCTGAHPGIGPAAEQLRTNNALGAEQALCSK